MTQIFRGLEQTDYQDLLRALGHSLDARGLRDLRLVERVDGFLVQARPAASPADGFWTEYLGDGELLRLAREGYQLRGSGPLAPPAGGLGLRYEDLLRAIGRLVDEQGACELRLVEEPHGVVVQMQRRGQYLRDFRTQRLGRDELQALAREVRGRRAPGAPAPPPG